MLLNINSRYPNLYPAIILLGCIILAVFSFRETSLSLFSHWLVFDESYGHGLLVLATCLYMIYRALTAGEITASGPGWFMLLPLLLCSFMLSLSVVAGIDLVQYVLLPAVIYISFYLVAGKNAAIRIFIPLGLIYFAIPFWDYFTNGLLALTSGVVQEMVYLSGITAFISGNSIYIPSGTIHIVTGCSGLRYFIIGTFLGVLSSYMNSFSLKRAAFMVSVFLGLSLLANWIRVAVIVWIAYYSQMQSSIVDDHETLGWIVFMLFMVPAFYMSNNLDRQKDAVEMASSTGRKFNISKNINARDAGFKTAIASFLVLVVMLASSSFIHSYEEINMSEMDLPDMVPPIGGNAEVVDYVPAVNDWVPGMKVPGNTFIKTYILNSRNFTVFRYLYVKDSQIGEILPYTSNIYGRDDWSIENTIANENFEVLELENKITLEKILVAYNINIGGFEVKNYLVAKIYQYLALSLQQPYALFSAVSMKCDRDCSGDRDELINFLSTMR